MEIAEQDGSLRASDDEDDEDQEKESIHVVDVRWPDGAQDEKKLNEDATEGQYSTHDDARNRLKAYAQKLVGEKVEVSAWHCKPWKVYSASPFLWGEKAASE